MRNVSIVIVDDHKLFREGLSLLLHKLTFIGDIKEASTGEEFLEIISDFIPDIVFMDIELPGKNGIDTTVSALKNNPDLNIIALSMYSDEDYYTKMINVGAKGFILKNSGIQEVETAIKHVLNGNNYFSQQILSGLLNSLNRKQKSIASDELSERETEILCLICKGLSNQEIADALFISKRTVDKHREHLLSKTNSKNTAGLVIYAIKHQIVDL